MEHTAICRIAFPLALYEGIIKCDYQMARKALVQMIAAPLWLLHSEEDYIALLQSAGAQ